MKTTINMATVPERLSAALKAINSLYDQTPLIRLYLNNFKDIPQEFKDDKISIAQGKDLKSSGKLFWAKTPNEHYFCVDDDILYPSDYIKYSLAKLREYNDNVIISYHGRKFDKNKKIQNYFTDRLQYFNFKNAVMKDTPVEVIGNGVSCWNTNNIQIDLDKFRYLYMDDILVSGQAAAQGKNRIVVAHKAGYLKPIKTANTALYDKYKTNAKTQTNMYNSIKW